MVKKIFPLFLLIFSFNFSQNVEEIKNIIRFSNQQELISYVNDAKSKGFRFDQVRDLAIAQGANNSELSLLENLWNKEDSETQSSNENNVSISSDIGFNQKIYNNSKPEIKKSNRFGSDFFNNSNISTSPQLYLATPKDYILGPGDEIIIHLYGASEKTYDTEISREGIIKLEKLAPIYLSGLNMKQAKSRLKFKLSEIYFGLKSSNQIEKVEIDLNLKKARSVVVNVIGQIEVPGTYTVSGFSSVLNVLYASGGPNEIGSYRNIKLIRSGKVFYEIDLYDYFTNGTYPTIYLQDQDVLYVPPLKKEVEILNGFKIKGKFELKDDENFNDIIEHSGGFSVNSYKEKIFVKRIKNLGEFYTDIDKQNYSIEIPFNGDVISAKTPNDFVSNKISISGSVTLAGNYSLNEIKTVGDLIESAKGFTNDALKSNALLYRTNEGLQNELISIDFNDETNLNFSLKNLDSLYVPSAKDLEVKKTIDISGEIKNPGTYPYKKNMSVKDAIILAGGFLNNYNDLSVDVFRNLSTTNNENLTEVFSVGISENLKGSENLILKNNDIISVRLKDYFQEIEKFQIEGEVKSRGFFAISKANQKLSTIFNNIEFKKTANFEAIYIERDDKKIPITFKNNVILNDLTVLKNDKIFIKKKLNLVYIEGEVQNQMIIPYKSNLSFLNSVSKAGGFTPNSDKSKSYVTYSNGSSKRTKKFLFFNIYPKVKLDSKIIIPKKIKKEKNNSGEIIGFSSALASIAAIISLISK